MSLPRRARIQVEIDSPRPLRAANGEVKISGWCFIEGDPNPPAIRLRSDAGQLPAITGQDRPDVARRFAGQSAAAKSGFQIAGRLPSGIFVIRVEAQLPGNEWTLAKELTLSVEPPALAAVLDEPITAGVLRDRVKVGGWAVHPDGPVHELTLRYGHREIACRTGLARKDVPKLFPEIPHARSAGFESEDFLVAGHGPVRIRARAPNGQVRVVATPLVYSIATDENHESSLDLTKSARRGLERQRAASPPPSSRAPRPLNVLFVLYGSFASNSAFHVAALADELARTGHSCAVAVPQEVDTLAYHDRPSFRGLAYAEAEQGVTFPDGRGPDLIHAWTTRENVRRLTESVRARQGARVVVHLEDNERQLLAHSLGREPAALESMGESDLDRLVPADLSHPQRSRRFLETADAVTILNERLREFVPSKQKSLLLRPAADARYFFPYRRPDEFRAVLDRAAGETVLFYHGNVHASNAAEVRELYAAVLQLNRDGQPVTLIRTGLDRVDFLGELAEAAKPHVLSLGQILHHRHLPALMALADIFVQPGVPDAFNDYRFPSKLPEFFALGRPVVLPRTNLGLAVRHGVDAYVLDRADAAGIVRAITELRRDRALYDRLGAGAAAYAAEHFNWRLSAESLARFYLSLLL